MLKAGIIGLPNVGKSTIFNALTNSRALSANYPFATIDPNIGVTLVKDPRLDVLKDMYNPKSVVEAAYQFFDIAGLVKGASNGEGLGNQFLSHIREVDAICHVVRCFDGTNTIHVEGSVNPIRDLEIVSLELKLADLEVIQKRLQRISKKNLNDSKSKEEFLLLEKIKKSLEEELDLKKVVFSSSERLIIKNFSLLSLKPVLIIANIADSEISNPLHNQYFRELSQYCHQENLIVIPVSAQLEMEISNLDFESQKEFLKSYGVLNSGLDEVIVKSYQLLGLKTFFTAGAPEVRAWTFKDGMKAPECAGIIHSDFQRGFIKAETISYSDLVAAKSMVNAKQEGKVRQEGKDYLVKDGDIMLFRFNV